MKKKPIFVSTVSIYGYVQVFHYETQRRLCMNRIVDQTVRLLDGSLTKAGCSGAGPFLGSANLCCKIVAVGGSEAGRGVAPRLWMAHPGATPKYPRSRPAQERPVRISDRSDLVGGGAFHECSSPPPYYSAFSL